LTDREPSLCSWRLLARDPTGADTSLRGTATSQEEPESIPAGWRKSYRSVLNIGLICTLFAG
jgi:hypothetical protein